MNGWHFGDNLCTSCEYNMTEHTGCAKTGTNFRLRDKENVEAVRRVAEDMRRRLERADKLNGRRRETDD